MKLHDWFWLFNLISAFLLCVAVMPEQWRIVYSPTTILVWALVVFVLGLVVHYVKHRNGLAALIHGLTITFLFTGFIMLLSVFGFWIMGTFEAISKTGAALLSAGLASLAISFIGFYYFFGSEDHSGKSD
jgi:hypothetical protein